VAGLAVGVRPERGAVLGLCYVPNRRYGRRAFDRSSEFRGTQPASAGPVSSLRSCIVRPGTRTGVKAPVSFSHSPETLELPHDMASLFRRKAKLSARQVPRSCIVRCDTGKRRAAMRSRRCYAVPAIRRRPLTSGAWFDVAAGAARCSIILPFRR